MVQPNQIDRKLAERSNLTFEYSQGEGTADLKVVLPFFENADIRETKKARYAKHSPLARPSTLFTYTGADARELKVDFNMTFDHILSEDAPLSKYWNTPDTADNIEAQQALFSQPSFDTGVDHVGNETGAWFDRLEENKSDFLADFFRTNEEKEIFGILNSSMPRFSGAQKLKYEQQYNESLRGSTYKRRTDILTLIHYWINIIRTSVMNNTNTPTLGPPIVRLNHGILYKNIPCIVTDYNLAIPPNGYDVATLMPRQIEVSMTLNEVRMGNFQKYDWYTTDQKVKDNLTGWESVINSPHTIDPGRATGFVEEV